MDLKLVLPEKGKNGRFDYSAGNETQVSNELSRTVFHVFVFL
jgi:hypothetical protein